MFLTESKFSASDGNFHEKYTWLICHEIREENFPIFILPIYKCKVTNGVRVYHF